MTIPFVEMTIRSVEIAISKMKPPYSAKLLGTSYEEIKSINGNALLDDEVTEIAVVILDRTRIRRIRRIKSVSQSVCKS